MLVGTTLGAQDHDSLDQLVRANISEYNYDTAMEILNQCVFYVKVIKKNTFWEIWNVIF